jgi:hypothetical protein
MLLGRRGISGSLYLGWMWGRVVGEGREMMRILLSRLLVDLKDTKMINWDL